MEDGEDERNAEVEAHFHTLYIILYPCFRSRHPLNEFPVVSSRRHGVHSGVFYKGLPVFGHYFFTFLRPPRRVSVLTYQRAYE